MQWLIDLIINAVKNFFAAKAKDLPPAVQDYVKLATEEAGLIVGALNSEPISGAEKKAKAVSQLVAFMKTHNLDLPGDLEVNVAGAVVEGAYLGLKEASASFLDLLNGLLKKK